MSARDFLFELGTEELPPRGLASMSAALAESIAQALEAAGIPHGKVRRFASPRRLAVLIERCAEHQPDRRIERRGPPQSNSYDAHGAPTQAALAFAKSCGVAVADLELLATDKGAWLVFRGVERGAETVSMLGAIVNRAIASLPVAKRMRWGNGAAEFVRPAHWVVVMFGTEVVACEVLSLRSGRITFGHRFHAPRPIVLKAPQAYEGALKRAKVIADFDKRRELIRNSVGAAAASLGGRALIEPALLDEVTALVEWPVPIAGRFEERFLALPREVVIATVQDHQRYFPIEDAHGRLNGGFVTVANIASRDPSIVRAGNERVVRPRLSDAAFFWDQDRKVPLMEHAAGLAGVTFQAQLGSYAQKTTRVAALALWIGAKIGAGGGLSRAAQLSKADLMTAMVGEFPELQGTMGRYYAAADGEDPEVAAALEQQYLPRFAGDVLPLSKLGQTLALADRIDTLVGIFAIDAKPTGTKDPFGLRRAALGVLRILLETPLDLDLVDMLAFSAAAQPVARTGTAAEVYAFIIERLRGLLAERAAGATVEMIEAVLAVLPRSPVDVAARLEALRDFLAMPDAAALTAANKRIGNILKKSSPVPDRKVDAERLVADAERRLYADMRDLAPRVAHAIGARRYGAALSLMLGLRSGIDAFFEDVMVMDENVELRHNRLALLRELQALIGGVADLARLPG